MEAAELYSNEEVRREAALKGDFSAIARINESLFNKTKHLPHYQFRDSKIEKELDGAYLSKDLLQVCAVVEKNHKETLPNEDSTEYRKFVEELIGVSLENVTIAHVSGNFQKAEGQASACGRDRHVVILPERGKAFLSADLIVHELGHTAEFTLRRQNDDVKHFNNHKILNETIAHFCQYRYLKEFGTRDEKISAVNSIVPLYMLLKVRIAARDLKISPSTVQTEKVINHKEMADLRKVYTTPTLRGALAPYEGQSLLHLYHIDILPRFGSVLALKLLNEPETIKKLCVAPTDKTVREILTGLKLNADKLLDFSKADELFKRFIAGTL